jgi:hypothetical protein
MVANTLSSPRKNFAAALLATGQVLLIGGSDGNNSLFTTDVFDPASTSVGAGSNLLMPLAALTANTLLDGTVLVVGGNDGMQDLASAEIYDPSAQSFSFIFGSLTVPRSGHLAFVIPDNNNVLIVGGMSNGAAQATCELYTLQDEFMPVGSTSTPRAHAAGVAIGPGLVLTAGGRNDEGVELHSGVNTGPSVTFPIPLGGAPAYTTLLIGGTQFKPGEIVNFQLQIKNNSGTQLNTLSPTTANIPSGNFFSQQDLSGLPAGYWTLTAVGQTSGLSASHGLVVLYPTITLSPSCNPCALGQVTLTARVKNASPSLYPGSVGAGDHMVFYDNPTSWGYGFPSLGTVSVIPNSDGSGTAIFTASFSAGTHGIPVDLQPAGADGFFYFVTPYLLTFTVNKAATSINLTASPNPARTDRPVTLQAAIPFTSGNTPPSGTVTFFDGVTQIGMPVLDASSKSAANLSLTTGTHVISAKYAGDANYLASASAAVNVTVNNPITPTVTVTASPNPVTVGQEVSINAVVSYPAGSPAPTGTVTFKAGLTTIGTVPISTVVSTSSVGAVLKLKPSGAGAYKVTATYNGNATYNSATSAPIGLTVIVILL